MSNVAEEWRGLVGEFSEWEYQVSSSGNVKSLRKKSADGLLSPCVSRGGYPMVVISRSGRTRNLTVHRLVAAAFIREPVGNEQVNHKNGIKTDNRSENLEWVSPSENTRHAMESGLKTVHYGERCSNKGEKNGNSKLTDDDVVCMRNMKASGVSSTEIARRFGVARTYASSILRGKFWKHVTQ